MIGSKTKCRLHTKRQRLVPVLSGVLCSLLSFSAWSLHVLHGHIEEVNHVGTLLLPSPTTRTCLSWVSFL